MRIVVLATICLIILSRVGFVTAAEEPATNSASNLSSYELFYPIVAGKIPGDKLYGIKMIRESVVGFFLFDSNKKGQYHITLSKKRIVEAEKLIETSKNYPKAIETLRKSLNEMRKADKLGEYKEDILVEATFMKRLAERFPDQQKEQVNSLADESRELTTD